MLHDLVSRAEFVAAPTIMIAERRSGKHIDRPGACTVRLPTPVALQNLRFLILGEHPLELDQQLVFRAVTARALDKLDPGTRPRELLNQQRLVGELPREPIG